MTRDDIIRMAREADLLVTTPIPDDSVFVADLERFAHLVAAAERQRNLDLVQIIVEAEREAMVAIVNDNTDGDGLCCADDLLAAIRARGEK